MVKNLSASQKTQFRALCREDPLEKGMTTHSSILARRIPWTEGTSLADHFTAPIYKLVIHLSALEEIMSQFDVVDGGT